MITSPIGKLLTGMVVCFLSICSISCLANDDIFISPYGNMNYYKKRTSEKDFSAGTDYDFSIQFARINDQSYLRTTTWKNKTIFEKVILNEGKFFTDGYYVKTSQGLTRNENAGFTYQKADPIANYTSKDPETGIELTCSSRLYDTLFTGVLPRQALTVIKKGKGITIKEVFIEGYGLTILVINGVIYTQILGDYDIKKDMMSTLNYSDPMACVLVNQTNMIFHSNKLSELYKTEKELAATARVSGKPALMELIQLEAKARILSANLSRTFKSTDLGVFTKSVIADYYLTASTIPIVNLEKETSAEEKNQLIAAYRQRIFTSPNIDEISKDIMNGDHFVTSQKKLFQIASQSGIRDHGTFYQSSLCKG